jgi:hypothetical protein
MNPRIDIDSRLKDRLPIDKKLVVYVDIEYDMFMFI